VGGVRLGVGGVVLVVCVCRCRGCCSLLVCVCVCDLLIFLQHTPQTTTTHALRRSEVDSFSSAVAADVRGAAPMWAQAVPVRKISGWLLIPLLKLVLYKILFHFKALLWVNHPFIAPLHLLSLPDFNTIARPLRSIRPSTDPSFLCHTSYNISDGNIV